MPDHHEDRKQVADRFWELAQTAREHTREYSVSTIRWLLVTNGGAAGAILASVSTIYSKDNTLGIKLAMSLKWSFVFYISGLICAVLSSAMGFFNFYYSGERIPDPRTLQTYIETGKLPHWAELSKITKGARYLATILAFSSVGAFVIGSIWAIKAFDTAFPTP
jgi:hypothetical protein